MLKVETFKVNGMFGPATLFVAKFKHKKREFVSKYMCDDKEIEEFGFKEIKKRFIEIVRCAKNIKIKELKNA